MSEERSVFVDWADIVIDTKISRLIVLFEIEIKDLGTVYEIERCAGSKAMALVAEVSQVLTTMREKYQEIYGVSVTISCKFDNKPILPYVKSIVEKMRYDAVGEIVYASRSLYQKAISGIYAGAVGKMGRELRGYARVLDSFIEEEVQTIGVNTRETAATGGIISVEELLKDEGNARVLEESMVPDGISLEIACPRTVTINHEYTWNSDRVRQTFVRIDLEKE